MSVIASRVIKISDISGKEMEESEAARLVVRKHPIADSQREIDVHPDEVATLKLRDDVVVLSLQLPNEPPRELLMLVADFRKVVTDEVIEKAKGVRGRAPASYR